ncbi:MAG: hypothetical protein R2778_01310 [Saprospiraceae bacterium]
MLSKLEIIGVGKVESAGVLRGVVSNIEKQLVPSAKQWKSGAECNEIQLSVHVGIAGQRDKVLNTGYSHPR